MSESRNQDLNDNIEQISYEVAFTEFEQIVLDLESGEKTLDEALTLYQRGKKLADHCSKLLDQAELKVKLLAGEELVDFD